jgi:SAM-dependent methyltransferase
LRHGRKRRWPYAGTSRALGKVDRLPDAIFEHQRLVAIYDALDPDRSDLDLYADIADELGARHLLDVGCGTGTFALLSPGEASR